MSSGSLATAVKQSSCSSLSSRAHSHSQGSKYSFTHLHLPYNTQIATMAQTPNLPPSRPTSVFTTGSLEHSCGCVSFGVWWGVFCNNSKLSYIFQLCHVVWFYCCRFVWSNIACGGIKITHSNEIGCKTIFFAKS